MAMDVWCDCKSTGWGIEACLVSSVEFGVVESTKGFLPKATEEFTAIIGSCGKL